MRVLTYNVHGWQTPGGAPNPEQVMAVIAGSDADVVGLNEVFHPTDGGAPALQAVADKLGMFFAFGRTQPIATDPGHPPYGNALLSRYPILAYAAHHLAPTTSYGRRGLLEVRLRLPSGMQLTIYVTHLDHRSEQIRSEQWSSANTWLLRDHGRPHLVLGDFNALAASDYPTSESLARLEGVQRDRGWPAPSFDLVERVLKAGYVDAFARSGDGTGATYPSDEPERRIDYIFLPQVAASRLRSCRSLCDPGVALISDHVPVLAEIDWY